MMKYRPFGSLDFNVSEISFGGAAVSGEGAGYGFGAISEGQSLELLRRAYEKGINLFDTAPIYGFGLSEKRIGKAFKQDREKVFLVSKSGVSWHHNKRVNMTNDPKETKKMLEQSLRDLQTDYIDLFMIHWPDEKVDIRAPMEVLAKAKVEGKIKAIGLCNTFTQDYQKAVEIDRIDVLQSEFNFFWHGQLDELFALVEKDKLGFMSWGTLDKGILTGRVTKTRTYEKNDCRKTAPWWDKKEVDKKVELIEKITPLLRESGHNGLELALGHNLSYPMLSTCLVGSRSIKQLESAIEALENLAPPSVVKTCLAAAYEI